MFQLKLGLSGACEEKVMMQNLQQVTFAYSIKYANWRKVLKMPSFPDFDFVLFSLINFVSVNPANFPIREILALTIAYGLVKKVFKNKAGHS